MNTLRFYFDYISHNAYLAWTQLDALCEKHDLVLQPVPVLFGAMLKANGQLGPAEIRGKNLWMLRDVLRKSQQYGIPLAPPASHPFNPLLSLRVTCTDMEDDQRRRLVTTLFEAAWVHSEDLSDPDAVRNAVSAAGLDGDAVMAAAGSDDAKSRLRQQTEDAIVAGVFGVPSMIAGERLFWGFDDLVHLDAFLAGRDPFDEADIEPWLRVKPSIQRVK
jgi:2-hydroxychromene-2-carboxylate isomerase